MACEFPVAVKSYVEAKLLYTVYLLYSTFTLLSAFHASRFRFDSDMA